jgi:predicted MFS family arabinose efflux permease
VSSSSSVRALPLAAFQVRSFRFQWPADLFTSCAFEMETLILGWYVLVTSNSVLVLTIFGTLQFMGTLAAPALGVLGDRLGSRVLLCAMRGSYAVLAAVLMALALAGALTPAAVLALSAVGGLLRPNDIVMRNSLIGETVPAPALSSALGMSRATMDSARVAGALAGASLYAVLGFGGAYVVVCAFYLASLALTFGVAAVRPARVAHPSHWRDLVEGLHYVWTTPRVLATLWLAFLVNLTAYPVTGGLMPYVARAVYGIDARGLGLLTASFALGALLGSLALVARGGARSPERSMVLGVLVWYAALVAFGRASTLSVGMPLLLVAGFAQSIGMVSMSVTLLTTARDHFRARVQGVRTLAVYGLPLGLMASGLLIDRVGYPTTVMLYCAIGLALTALIAYRWAAHLWHA